MSQLRLSAVLCTWKRPREVLAEALSRLMEQSERPDEVVVVDNEASEALRADLAEAAAKAPCPVRYAAEPKLGLSHARNRGAALAQGDLIAFLDDDAFALPGWAEAMRKGAAEHPEAGVFGGPVELLSLQAPPAGFLEQVAPFAMWLGAYDLGPADRGLPEEATYQGPVGANMAFRRAALDAIGGFDPSLGRVGASLVSCEELAAVNAARKAGHGVFFLARARVQHLVGPERLTAPWFIRRSFSEGVSIARALKAASPGADWAASAAEQARSLAGALERAQALGQTVSAMDLATQIQLAKILGRVSEHALEPGVASKARDALQRLRSRRELLELPLEGEAQAFFQ